MRKLFLLAGAAALGLAMPAAAKKGEQGGHSGGKGHAQVQGEGGGKKDRGGPGASPSKPHKLERQARRDVGRIERAERRAFRQRGPERAIQAERRLAREIRRPPRVERRRVEIGRDLVDLRRFRDEDRRFVSLDAGCPPGLAKKRNGCLPPGQAKKLFGLGDRLQPAWFTGYALPDEYRAFYHDSPDHYYRYNDDGYIYRVDTGTNLISGIVPLLGGGFAVGQPLPMGYDVYNLPLQYRDVWHDTDDTYYRYADDAIYGVDAETGIIESIVALLAGDLNVGQPLPAGYDAYNLPLDYRDEYADGDDHLYRYADGNIYQVDAETQIVQAIVEMLV
jgi:hypothetical protein